MKYRVKDRKHRNKINRIYKSSQRMVKLGMVAETYPDALRIFRKMLGF